jgi:hypothetical protein
MVPRVECNLRGMYVLGNAIRTGKKMDIENDSKEFDRKKKKLKGKLKNINNILMGRAAHIIITSHYHIHHPDPNNIYDRWLQTVIRKYQGDIRLLRGNEKKLRIDILANLSRQLFEIKPGLDRFDKEIQIDSGIKQISKYIDILLRTIPQARTGFPFTPGVGENGSVMLSQDTRLRWETAVRDGKSTGVILYVFEEKSGENWEKIPEKLSKSLELISKAKLYKNHIESTNVPQPNNIPQYAPDNIPQHVPDNIPQHVPDNIPQHVPDNIPQYIPDNVSQYAPDISDSWPTPSPGQKILAFTAAEAIIVGKIAAETGKLITSATVPVMLFPIRNLLGPKTNEA